MATIDPQNIQSAAQIPPDGSQFQGTSALGLVDVYYGTLDGDVDAQPAAQELLATEPDTGGLANVDYIYNQLSKIYGNVQLPSFASPSGNSVKAVVFVSGSAQGGYGAFHIPSSQTDFDRIVVDSLTSSGNYSSGSTVAPAQAAIRKLHGQPRLMPKFLGGGGLRGVHHAGDHALKGAKPAALRMAISAATQSRSALAKCIELGDAGATPAIAPVREFAKLSAESSHASLARHLVRANVGVAALLGVAAGTVSGRQYLSTALFAAELIESFEMLTGKGDSGFTDGEAVSRVVSFLLAPEIALVPGFSSGVTQQWWADGHPDFVNDNSQTDQSTDGNGAGVMFLRFLNDFLGVPMDSILAHMPATGGAPLGQTYVALLNDLPGLAQIAGPDGPGAFAAMVNLLQQNALAPDGSLNLPADGNPFPSMPNAQRGGLFSAS